MSARVVDAGALLVTLGVGEGFGEGAGDGVRDAAGEAARDAAAEAAVEGVGDAVVPGVPEVDTVEGTFLVGAEVVGAVVAGAVVLIDGTVDAAAEADALSEGSASVAEGLESLPQPTRPPARTTVRVAARIGRVIA